ncbi:breast cancer anti-estrogen resistance protein 3 homolog isoform X2 [Ptychodera flava]|uniref:breast cancer anti-estrogen resistance protein 3 homolog isoform X2 n=1 Tax=Ptychodera flava TaxID=63121 RepID=UPI003969E330
MAKPGPVKIQQNLPTRGYGMMPTNFPIADWLKSLGLQEYAVNLKTFRDVESLFCLTENDFRQLGVRNGAHRARIVSSIVMLKQRHRYSMANQMSPTKMSHGMPPANQGSPGYRPHYTLPRSPLQSPGARYETVSTTVTPSRLEPPKDISPEKLKKDLEMELKLENDDIRSHAWFHGCISRDIAERLLRESGDFVVRDCISQPGDYVLTMKWNSSVLHFIINRVVLNPDTTTARVQYQFEKESFDSIPSLIRYYVGNKKAISLSSQAVISRPINRTLPLSYTDAKYALTPAQIQMLSGSPGGSAPSSPRASRHQRSGSQPTVLQGPNFMNKMMERSESQPHIQQTVPSNKAANSVREGSSTMMRYGSEPLLSPKVERRSFGNEFPPLKQPGYGSDSELSIKQVPPPKPSRVSSILIQEPPQVSEMRNEYEGPFDDYSELDQQEPMPIRYSKLHDQDRDDVLEDKLITPMIKPKIRGRKFSDTRNSLLDSRDYGYHTFYPVPADTITEDSPDVETREFFAPKLETESLFKPMNFASSLLSQENRPLEGAAVIQAKTRLNDADTMTIAKYITSEDLKVSRIVSEKHGNISGLELLTLPQGTILRQDLLERYNCLKYWVSITILTCLDTGERVRLLMKWIQTAEMLKSTMGNLYGFCAVMDALCSSQITNLKLTWDMLRQSHTNMAIMFETKLRQVYKSLNNGDSSSIPVTRTSIPNIVPLLQLLERSSSAPSNQELWETGAEDYGLGAMLAHLDAARCYAQESNLYKVTAESKVKGLSLQEELMDCFRTEFHLRILWGFKGSEDSRDDRYSKFNHILTAMTDRIEPLQTL